jgi:hypothetical protein
LAHRIPEGRNSNFRAYPIRNNHTLVGDGMPERATIFMPEESAKAAKRDNCIKLKPSTLRLVKFCQT